MFQADPFKTRSNYDGQFNIVGLRKRLRRVCSRLRWLISKRPRLKLVVIKRLRKKFKPKGRRSEGNPVNSTPDRPIRIVTFNVAMFSLAPAVPVSRDGGSVTLEEEMGNSQLKSILKQSPLDPGLGNGPGRPARPKMKVSINLPDNEISLANSKFLGFVEGEKKGSSPIVFSRTKVPVRSPICFPYSTTMSNFLMTNMNGEDDLFMMEESKRKSIYEVLREVNADILGLQDVKAEEEKGMRPLSDLARALGMHYVFAESWAPEYGNAVLSRWPIKRWRAQKIADDDDFRNVLKATIEVPGSGDLNFSCTQLDHLDEYWRMRQVQAIVQSYDPPDILAGGLNSLDESDYSLERWMDIVRYYEDIGKPTPKAEVTKFMNLKQYIDAKHFAGDCEPVVIIAKGQNVQGTCKYGTRVDYVLASPNSPFMFLPNSYSVVSSKGTSDHHIVKADVIRVPVSRKEGNGGSSSSSSSIRKLKQLRKNVVKMASSPFSCRSSWHFNN